MTSLPPFLVYPDRRSLFMALAEIARDQEVCEADRYANPLDLFGSWDGLSVSFFRKIYKQFSRTKHVESYWHLEIEGERSDVFIEKLRPGVERRNPFINGYQITFSTMVPPIEYIVEELLGIHDLSLYCLDCGVWGYSDAEDDDELFISFEVKGKQIIIYGVDIRSNFKPIVTSWQARQARLLEIALRTSTVAILKSPNLKVVSGILPLLI